MTFYKAAHYPGQTTILFQGSEFNEYKLIPNGTQKYWQA